MTRTSHHLPTRKLQYLCRCLLHFRLEGLFFRAQLIHSGLCCTRCHSPSSTCTAHPRLCFMAAPPPVLPSRMAFAVRTLASRASEWRRARSSSSVVSLYRCGAPKHARQPPHATYGRDPPTRWHRSPFTNGRDAVLAAESCAAASPS